MSIELASWHHSSCFFFSPSIHTITTKVHGKILHLERIIRLCTSIYSRCACALTNSSSDLHSDDDHLKASFRQNLVSVNLVYPTQNPLRQEGTPNQQSLSKTHSTTSLLLSNSPAIKDRNIIDTMPRLMELAVEIILKICDHTDTWTIQRFARCNRFLFELTEQKRYERISFRDSDPFNTTSEFPTNPLLFLHRILWSPHLALFPKVLTLGVFWYEVAELYEKDGEDDLRYEICTAISSTGRMAIEEVEGWYSHFLCADRHTKLNMVIVQILKFLPNVQSIQFLNGFFDGLLVQDLFDTALRHSAPLLGISKPRSSVLGKLRRVYLDNHLSNPDDEGIPLMVKVGSMPSVTTLSARSIYWSSNDIIQQDLMRCTDLQHLDFQESEISIDIIQALVKQSGDLRSFRYEHDNSCTGLVWDPTHTIRILHEYAKDTLASLDLTKCSPEVTSVLASDLSDFHALGSLRLDAFLLEPHHSRRSSRNAGHVKFELKPRTLGNALPTCLQQLTLVCKAVEMADVSQIKAMLGSLAAEKGQRLPDLQRIELEDIPSAYLASLLRTRIIKDLEAEGVT